MMERTFYEQNLDSVQSGRVFALNQDSSPTPVAWNCRVLGLV